MLRKRLLTVLPQLTLSADEESELRQLSQTLEDEAVAHYEQFLFRHRRRVDTTRWKALRSHEDVHVYIERDDFLQTWRHESKRSAHAGPMAAMTANSSTPMMFVTATVQGLLDDALLGMTFRDSTSLRVRDAHLKQTTDEAWILSVLDDPDIDDPFRFLGITYATRKSPTSIGHARDLLLLTGVHASTLSTGESIAISFHHSITHDQVPISSSTIRATASMVAIYRQLGDHRVDVFILDFCDLHGKVLASAGAKQTASLLVPRTQSCAAGLEKKLHWLMRERLCARRKKSAPEFDTAVDPDVVMPEPNVDPEFCEICDTTLHGPGRSACICRLCGEHVCAKCTVSKDIAVDVTATAVESKRFAFCVACMHYAKQYPANDIAQRQVEERWTQSGSRQTKQSECDYTRPTSFVEFLDDSHQRIDSDRSLDSPIFLVRR